MIRCSCPTCSAHLEVLDTFAGQKIACPQCGQRLQIPSPTPALNRTILAGSPSARTDGSGLQSSLLSSAHLSSSDDVVNIVCPSCQRGLKVKPSVLGRRGKCPKCGCILDLTAIAPSVPEPTPSPEFNIQRPRWSVLAFLLGSSALLLGMLAVPVAIISVVNLLGALLTGIGFLLGFFGLIAALARRRPPVMPVVGLVVCISATLTVVLMARGPNGWLGPLADLLAGGSDQETSRVELSRTETEKQNEEAPPLSRAEKEVRNEKAAPRQSRRHEEEESPAERTPRRVSRPKTDLDRLIEQLKGEKIDDRIAAAERLQKMGEKARPAARALCEAIVSPTEALRRAALEALEKVDPTLYKQVLLLVVDQNAFNHIQASNALGAMGDDGAAAVPVILAHGKGINSMEEHFGNADAMLMADIAALAKLGPGEPQVVELFKELTKYQKEKNRGWQVRPAAINALVASGKARPALRKELVPVLLAATEITIFQQHDEMTCLAALKALGEFGADAKAAVPKLKDLKLSSSMQIRDAARAALEKIDKDTEQ